MSLAVWGGLIASLGMVLLRVLLPARIPEGSLDPGETRETLSRKYSKWERLEIALLIVTLFTCWPLMYFVLRFVGEMHAASLGPAKFLLTPTNFVWTFPAFLMGMTAGASAIDLFIKRQLGNRYEEFRIYRELMHGRVERLKVRHVLLLLFVPPLIAFLALLDTYAIFREDEIVLDRLLRLSARQYAYSDVERIVAASQYVSFDGKTRAGWNFVIHFENGDHWNSVLDPSGSDEATRRTLAALVSAKSGQTITEVEVLQRVDQ